jgi:hypothetical protein
MSLEGILVLVIVCVIGKDRGVGGHLHVNGGILGVLLPKRRVIVLILNNEQNPDGIN